MMTERREYRTEDVEDYFGQFYDRARNDFETFRHLKRPNMRWGWWTEEVARELQRFYRDLTEGRRPKLALMAPPQTGKSWTVWDFIAWIAGKHPSMKTIFGSYSDDLGVECNRDLQRTIKSDFFNRIFPDTRIDEPGWACSKDHHRVRRQGWQLSQHDGERPGKRLPPRPRSHRRPDEGSQRSELENDTR